MMMVAAPDCVRREKFADAHGSFTASRGLGVMSAINVWRSFKDLTPSGVIGDARKATPEKGEKLLATAAELLAAELLKGAPWA